MYVFIQYILHITNANIESKFYVNNSYFVYISHQKYLELTYIVFIQVEYNVSQPLAIRIFYVTTYPFLRIISEETTT